MDDTDVIPQTYLNGEVIPVVDPDKHLGNHISTNITDINIIDPYQKSIRKVISDFRACHSNALDNLRRTYYMLSICNYMKDFKVAWRKIIRRINDHINDHQQYINDHQQTFQI